MKSRAWTYLLIGLVITSLKASATRPQVDPKLNLELVYGSLSSNVNSQKKDEVYLIFFEGIQGRYKLVKLTETDNNSSTFSANLDLSDWADLDFVVPEIYFTESNTPLKPNELEVEVQKIEKGLLKRRPLILKKHISGLQIIDIYNSQQDLQDSLSNYKRNLSLRLANESLEQKINTKLPEQSFIDRATSVSKLSHLAVLERKENQKQIVRERHQLELKNKLQSDIEKAMSESQSSQNYKKNQAKKLSEKALKFYQEKKYEEAEKLYKQSLNLYPQDDETLYFYGVTLYRLKKFEDSLIHLNLVKAEGSRLIEVKYFIALNHFKLEELNRSIILFRAVKATEHKLFAASAAFYEGLILYSQEKFVEAKEPFEYVIDHSSDPELDNKAESYLEDIAWKIYYKKHKLNKWALYLEAQAIYDSNVLYATDDETEQGQSGLSDKKSGGRGQLVSNMEYRFLYDEKNEMSTTLGLNYMYSLDKEFKRADPFLVDFEIPYKRKTQMWNKAAQWRVIPGYELLYMDAEDTGTRENIQSEGGIDSDLTIVNTDKWISTYSLNVSIINSNIRDLADGKDNADSQSYELRFDNSFYLGKGKRTALIPSLVFKFNKAEGDNRTYERVDLGLTYMNSQRGSFTWYANLNYYHLNFPDHDEKRSDNNVAFASGFSHSFAKSWGWGLNLLFMKNDSNVIANDYNKFMATTQINYTWE